MLSIHADLQSAASANSRSPRTTIKVEKDLPEWTSLTDLTTYLPWHIMACGSYYLCTAVPPTSGGWVIYAKKMTSLTSGSDWTSGWTTIANPGEGLTHDMYIDSDDAVIVYGKFGYGTVYYKESSDGGSSWGSEQTFPSLPNMASEPDSIALSSLTECWVHYWDSSASQHVTYRLYRSAFGNSWSLDGQWTNGKYWTFSYVPGALRHTIFARNVSDYVVLTGSAYLPYTHQDMSVGRSWQRLASYRNGIYSSFREALGGTIDNQDYTYTALGLSRPLNGFIFAGIGDYFRYKADEQYGAYADSEYIVGKTADLDSYELLPTSLTTTHAAASPGLQWFAGAVIAENGTQICVPITQPYTNGEVGKSRIYLCDYTSWWGRSTPSETEITSLIREPITISKEVRGASSASLQVSNIGDTYQDHATVDSGTLVRISAGYNTASGVRLQQRFVGRFLNKHDNPLFPKNVAFDTVGLLFPATGVAQSRHIALQGQNVFNSDFSEEADLDQFTLQNGEWAVESGRLKQTALEKHSFAIAGYLPDVAHVITANFRFDNAISGNFAGIAAIFDPTFEYRSSVVRYNSSTEKFEVIAIRFEDESADIAQIAESSSTYPLSYDTDYWLRVEVRYGHLSAWYGTSDETFTTQVLDDVFLYYSTASHWMCQKGNVGVYAYCSQEGDEVSFSNVHVFSMQPPMSGSDALEFLSRSIGLSTSEIKEMEDDFSTLGSRWDTPGVDGTWSIVSGKLKGLKSGSDPALLRNDIDAEDIILSSNLILDTSNHIPQGLMVRGNDTLTYCYAAFVSCTSGTTRVSIRRKYNDSWTLLAQIERSKSLTNVKMTFMARAGFLSVFLDDEFILGTYDENIESGYVGTAVNATSGNPYFDDFVVDGFYKPLDVVVSQAKGKLIAPMIAIADMYDGGEFFCDEYGVIVWGVFSDTTVDLDIREFPVNHTISFGIDKVLSIVRVEGNNAYGEARDNDWAIKLGGHRFEMSQDKSVDSGSGCVDRASERLAESRRLYEESLSIMGQPALQLCDNIGIARLPDDSAESRRILALSEVTGLSTYRMEFSGLESNVEVEP